MSEQPKRNSTWRLITSILLLLVAVLVFVFRQDIIDQYSLRTYKPSTEIQALARDTTMTDRGRFLFYASQPRIQDRQQFNDTCVQRGEKTVVLGCYALYRIYIFDVTDERLDGIKEVTAAHEMLHAAYDRLSGPEKKRIDALVEAELKNINDERINSLVAAYEKTEPGERANELHSILGTEVETLTPELETYYAKYFTNRKIITSLSRSYESVFTQITTEQNELVAELNTLSSDITSKSAAYNEDTKQLNAAIEAFNARANSGQFESQAEFNSERQKLVAQQQALQKERQDLNANIATYNQKRSELEALNGQAEDLNRSINSQLSPVPSV